MENQSNSQPVLPPNDSGKITISRKIFVVLVVGLLMTVGGVMYTYWQREVMIDHLLEIDEEFEGFDDVRSEDFDADRISKTALVKTACNKDNVCFRLPENWTSSEYAVDFSLGQKEPEFMIFDENDETVLFFRENLLNTGFCSLRHKYDVTVLETIRTELELTGGGSAHAVQALAEVKGEKGFRVIFGLSSSDWLHKKATKIPVEDCFGALSGGVTLIQGEGDNKSRLVSYIEPEVDFKEGESSDFKLSLERAKEMLSTPRARTALKVLSSVHYKNKSHE